MPYGLDRGRESTKTETEVFRPRLRYVLGPDGSPLTIADLPPPNTKRWVVRRKGEVVAAVRGGLLSLDDACKRYDVRSPLIADACLAEPIKLSAQGYECAADLGDRVANLKQFWFGLETSTMS